ncbi:MAG: winged helix-turn-helix transcriptional regulator [Thalassobaculum sp.]|uniref:MarR family winged helix-turn-helix transcriptional regulator n=1 Tax=Thalassobaculum sp. TaxID=2022740 RepID=UPI0032ED2ED0
MTDRPPPAFPPLRYGILHDLVGHLLRHSYNRAFAAFEAAFGDEDISPLQFMIFELIQNNPGVTHGDVTRAMGTAPSVVTTTLKPMLKDGRIASAAKAGDTRQRVYEATAEGLRWFERIRPAIMRSEDDLTESLTADERAELLRMLRLLLGIAKGG